MKNWRDVIIDKNTTIAQVMALMNETSLQIALVVDAQQRLQGVITDGDIRRGLLKKMTLSTPAYSIMNAAPKTADKQQSQTEILQHMQRYSLHHMPVVDEAGRVIALETIDELIQTEELQHRVVIMAGGLGKRLQPLTDECPKPLLKVGGKPILEIIINQLVAQGLTQLFIVLNYKGEMIKQYFQAGDRWGVTIDYIEETQPLGTAGGLSLLPLEKLQQPFIVMNADLLTTVNYRSLLNFHLHNKAQATMCVKQYQHEIPYGVVENNEHDFMAVHEKPVQTYFVNAGIYVLNSELLKYIPPAKKYDMVDLFQQASAEQQKLCTFPIYEGWQDLGCHQDYQQANKKYDQTIG